jgi:hypothetical protein
VSRSHDSKAGSGTLSAKGLEENTIAVIIPSFTTNAIVAISPSFFLHFINDYFFFDFFIYFKFQCNCKSLNSTTLIVN